MDHRRGAAAAAAVFATACAGLASGCTVHVFSPPAAAADLRPAGTLGAGRIAVGGSAGAHVAPGIFDDTTTASVIGGHVAVGATDDVDVHASYQRIRVGGDTGNEVDPDRLRGDASDVVQAGHVGVTGQLVPRGGRSGFVLSLDGGVGAGRSDAGAFLAPDVALRIGWEWPYAALFLGLRWAPSFPLDARAPPLDLGAFDDGPSVSRLEPRLTHMVRGVTGVAFTLPLERGALLDPNGRPRAPALRFLLAFVYTEINDTEERLPFAGGLFAVDLVIPGLWGGAGGAEPAPRPRG